MENSVVLEFDCNKHILHLSLEEEISITDKSQLDGLCGYICSALEKHGQGERCYLIVDISRLSIDPRLSHYYSQKVKYLLDNLLHPEGLVRYGYKITRVTAHIGHETYLHNDPHLFATRRQAFAYVENLILKNNQRAKDKIMI